MAKTTEFCNIDDRIRGTTYGRVDEKGHWRPPYASEFSPIFSGGSLKAILKFFFGWGGYLWPRTLTYVLLAFGTFKLLENDINTFNGLGGLTWTFALTMLLRNMILIWFVFGGYHLLLYILKVEGDNKKYHPEGQIKGSKRFMFNNQVYDNVFRSCISGVPIWTAYEILYIVLVSRGFIPYLTFESNPVWFVAQFLLIPIWRETHFYIAHKILHMGWMMRKIHRVHHMNPNPGPWSGMAMHPVEHVLYFSVVLIHFVVPSHPMHFFFNSQHTALTPAAGHTGFEGPLLGGLLPNSDYFHYLHHKHVACNFGGATIPWDKWFGIYYNGEGKSVNKM